VLELPDDGPYVTETCSIIKVHFCYVNGLFNHFIHLNSLVSIHVYQQYTLQCNAISGADFVKIFSVILQYVL
jgi:hypothetical protein